MRTATSGMLDKLATQYGSAPFFVLGINWSGKDWLSSTANRLTLYADKNIYDDKGNVIIKGKILKIDNIESILNLSGNQTTISINITMDDSDGEFINLINNIDIHYRICKLYQHFDGLPLGDMLELFEGNIITPSEFSDVDRTFKFSIATVFQGYESGFSPEEGDVADLREDLIGKAWPLVFGTVYKCPLSRITDIPVATTCSPMGFHDRWLDFQIVRLSNNDFDFMGLALFFFLAALQAYNSEDTELGDQLTEQGNQMLLSEADKQAKILNLQALLAQQTVFDTNSVYVLTDYPINLKGVFEVGGTFVVGEMHVIHKKTHQQLGQGGFGEHLTVQGVAKFTFDGPYHSLEFHGFSPSKSELANVGPTQIGIVSPKFGTITDLEGAISRDVSEFVYIEAGSTVKFLGNYPVKYVANIIPCKIHHVYARRTFESYSRRMLVSKEFYKRINVVAQASRQLPNRRFVCPGVRLFRPLNTLLNQRWADDELFATIESTVGPYFHDIVTYLVRTFTVYDVDTASLETIPRFRLNFAVLEIKDTVTLIQEICFQCKVAVQVINGKFRFIYIPLKTLSGITITLNDLIENSLTISFTNTEDLITKMIGTWRFDWSDEKQNRIVIRYNVAKYGTNEVTHDFYCFNVQKAVEASMSFWLYRKGNSWKKIKIKVPLKFLTLENYDIIELDSNLCSLYGINNGATTPAVVENIIYDVDDNILELSLELPIKLGENKIDPLYWPSDQGFQWMGTGEVSQIFNNILPPTGWNGVDGTPLAMLGPIYINSRNDQDTSTGIPTIEGPLSHQSLNLPNEWDFDMATQNPPGPGNSPTPVVGSYGGTLGDYVAPAIRVAPAATGVQLSRVPAPKFPSQYQDPTKQQQQQQTGPAGSNTFIGKVVSGSGHEYKLDIFPKGPDSPPTRVEGFCLEIASDQIIPENSWVEAIKITVSKVATTGPSVTVKTDIYYFTIPVWLA